MQNHYSATEGKGKRFQNSRDSSCKIQLICLKVISVYYIFFPYLRILSIDAISQSEEHCGLHCENAVKSGFRTFHKRRTQSFLVVQLLLSRFLLSVYWTVSQCSIRNTPPKKLYGERAMQTNWGELVSSGGKLKSRLDGFKYSFFSQISG